MSFLGASDPDLYQDPTNKARIRPGTVPVLQHCTQENIKRRFYKYSRYRVGEGVPIPADECCLSGAGYIREHEIQYTGNPSYICVN
jgi:hypothetical protein